MSGETYGWFSDELYNAFGDITDKLFDIVCNTQLVDICLNDISFSEFTEIIEVRGAAREI